MHLSVCDGSSILFGLSSMSAYPVGRVMPDMTPMDMQKKEVPLRFFSE